MWNIIIVIIGIGIVGAIIEGIVIGISAVISGLSMVLSKIFASLSGFFGGPIIAVIIIISALAAFLAFGWVGVAVVCGILVVLGLVKLLLINAKKTILEHDKNKKEVVQMRVNTQVDKQKYENEKKLQDELDANCRWLGYMNESMWKEKLPNYVNKKYKTDFFTITFNFAKQIEKQNITQNDEWFQPYLNYIIAHPQGKTVTQLLNEVNCPQLYVTHVSSNGDLLNTRLMKGTQPISKDVPALFNSTYIKDINEYIFTPTKYALKIYGKEETNLIASSKEISFEDL